MMIDIKQNPEAILTLDHDDIVTYEGTELVMTAFNYDWNVSPAIHNKVFFTTVKSRNSDEYGIQYSDDDQYHLYIHHLRENGTQKAVLTRSEWISSIVSNNCKIW